MFIKIQNKEIEIKVIPIKKYPDLLNKFKTLPAYFNKLAGKTNDEVFEMAPELITACLPDVLAIFSEATKIKVEELEQLGLSELIDIFVAVVKENQFIEAIQKLKKEFAQKPTETTPILETQ